MITGTFNGSLKLFICDIGTTFIDVAELYSAWKEWVQSGQGINYLPAFEAIGGQPLPGGLFAGQTYFLINNWKIKPQEANHSLTILGNLYTSDGSPTTVSVAGYTIEINLNTSSQAQGISGSTLTTDDIWSYSNRSLTETNNITMTILTAIAMLPNSATIAELKTLVEEIYLLHGLASGSPLVVTDISRTAGSVTQAINSTPTQTTVTRQ
jgi:hypothetical protein